MNSTQSKIKSNIFYTFPNRNDYENLQMTNFMSCNDNSAETTGVFDDGNTIDFLQAFVNHTSSTNIREPFNLELFSIRMNSI